jgi:Domain of unknown function (DUF6285)
MRRQPTAANLLETARTALRQSIVPFLTGPAHYQALMVARAMAIAARQLEVGEGPEEAARARLASLYDAPAATLEELERRLGADLRRGAFDEPGAKRDAVFRHLWETTQAMAAECCPKALLERR